MTGDKWMILVRRRWLSISHVGIMDRQVYESLRARSSKRELRSHSFIARNYTLELLVTMSFIVALRIARVKKIDEENRYKCDKKKTHDVKFNVEIGGNEYNMKVKCARKKKKKNTRSFLRSSAA